MNVIAAPPAVQSSVDQSEVVTEVTSKRVRLDYIDGIRGLAALYVVIHHAWCELFFPAPDSPEPIYQFGNPPHIMKALNCLAFGEASVAVFIVLSGFCLTIPIAKTANYALPGGFLPYIKRRAQRILPPYYAALALCLLLIGTVPALSHTGDAKWLPASHAFTPGIIVSHLLLIHDLLPGWSFAVDYPMWSIALEWQFYFCLPFILLPLFRKAGIPLTVLFSLIAVAVFHALHTHNLIPLGLFIPSTWLFTLFAMGIAAALIVFDPKLGEKPAYSWMFSPITPGLAWVVWLAYEIHKGVPTAPPDFIIGFATAATLIAFSAKLIKEPDHRRSPILSFLESKPVVGLGLFSYSLYLIHAPVLALALVLCYKVHGSVYSTALLEIGGGTVLSLVVAYTFHRIFERPFMRLQPKHLR